jgi:hypothetical protein
MSDLVLMQCIECGWLHEAIYPSLDFKDEHKYLHCHNCYGDYLNFEPVKDLNLVNLKRYKAGVKILVDY